jgi:hypothetical protein
VAPVSPDHATTTFDSGDLDGDGRADIALVQRALAANGIISVLISQGGGSFRGVGPFDIGGRMSSGTPRIVDWDGDGAADVLVGIDPPELVWLRGDGSGNLSAPVSVLPGATGAGSFGDFDGDGALDFVTFMGGSRVFHGDGSGGVRPGQILGSGGGSFVGYNAPLDLDGDGALDLLGVANGSVAVRRGDGTGAFGPHQIYPQVFGTLVLSVAAADIDGDGEIELVTSSYQGPGITVYELRN